MQLLQGLARLVSRFRYPVSLPEDVGKDLGTHCSNLLRFHDFLALLSDSDYRPTTLRRLMPRQQAERSFQSALKREIFHSCSLFSYYFHKRWLVITLYFDKESRLRRLHLTYPDRDKEGFDIPLL